MAFVDDGVLEGIPRGQAVDREDKVRICEHSYNLLTREVGFPPSGHHL